MKALQGTTEKEYKYGSAINATITGSPIIQDGIVSGFSTSNYLNTFIPIEQPINSFEVYAKFTTGSTLANYEYILGPIQNGTTRTSFQCQVSGLDDTIAIVFYDNDTWSGINAKIGVATNTTYWCKWIYDGTDIKGYYSLDGINYTLTETSTSQHSMIAMSTFTSGNQFIGIGSSKESSTVFHGSIDLEKTYITINGKNIWSGTYPEPYDGPYANIVRVGSLNVSPNNVISGFNSTNWALLRENFNPGTSNWEMCFQFTTGTIGTAQYILCDTTSYQVVDIYIDASNKIHSTGYVNNTTTKLFEITGTTTLQANTIYCVALSYNSTSGYTLKLGTSSSDLAVEGTSSVTTPIKSGILLGLGVDFTTNGAYYGNPFTGSIDLYQSYIKVDNVLWWDSTSTWHYLKRVNTSKIDKNTTRTYYKKFIYTDDSVFTVPSNITNLIIDCIGAQGYTPHTSAPGGKGGRVRCNLAVTPGQVLNLIIGKQPTTNAVTYNATDIRIGGTELENRIIVAGGGGAGCYNTWPGNYYWAGGVGGGLIGGSGNGPDTTNYATGGTQSAGGLGSIGMPFYDPTRAESGTLGYGGAPSTGGNAGPGGANGAGGAGYYGGGGSRHSGVYFGSSQYGSSGGSAGGGSSYTDSTLCSQIEGVDIHMQGYKNGDGYISIAYESTSSDYDYYIDNNTYKALKV